jgi:hypothetical protein
MLLLNFHEHVFKLSGQIGRNFFIWEIFFKKKSPNDLGAILAEKKSPKILLNMTKI